MTKLVNRAKMTTATTGTGTITLGSAVDGYQTFAAAGVSNADVVRYVIEDGDAWEIGLGTYSAGTLTRGSIESSNADAALNLTGNAVVYVSAAAADLQELVDFADNFVLPTADGSTGQVLTTNGAGTLTFSTIAGGATDINGLSDGYSDGSSVGLGSGALANDDGTTNRNTAVGWEAGNALTSGALNTFVGYRAGYLAFTASSNTAVGVLALDAITTSSGNTAIGQSSGGVYTGDDSTFLGREAGGLSTTGIGQVLVGRSAGLYSTTGLRNIAVGQEALYGNTVSNLTGSYNIGLGYQTGYDLSSGEYNFLGGYRAGTNLTTGSNNVAIGNGAGDTLTTGGNNIVLGNGSDPSSATVSNEITLGNGSITRFRVPGLGIDWTSATVPSAPDVVKLSSTTVSTAVSSVDFTLPSGYTYYSLVFKNLKCSADASFAARFSVDGGSTFLSGSTNYYTQALGVQGSSVTAFGFADNVSYLSTFNLESSAGYGASGKVDIFPNASGEKAYIHATAALTTVASGNPIGGSSVFSEISGTTSVINAIRILFVVPSANITAGSLTLYGHK